MKDNRARPAAHKAAGLAAPGAAFGKATQASAGSAPVMQSMTARARLNDDL
jgi:hypothetical protein